MADPITYVLIGHYPLDKQASMQRFDALILKMLEHKKVSYTYLEPSVRFGKLAFISFLSKWLGYIDKYILFPWKLKKELKAIASKSSLFVIITDHSHGIYVPELKEYPHVIHLHDFLAIKAANGEYPQIQIGRLGKQLQARILKGLCMGTYFISISEATRGDAQKLLGDRPIDIVYNELNFPFKRNAEKSYFIQDINIASYFLHVGNSLWYKNRGGVLELFKQYLQENPESISKLIIVGDDATDCDQAFLDQHDVKDRVFFYNGISSSELESLYSHATGLLFPSIAEGFGWPIIEAAACGCPVITTDLGPMSEIAADSRLLIPLMPDPRSTEYAEWLNLGVSKMMIIERWKQEERIEYSKKSMSHAAQFGPGQATEQYWKIYQGILSAS